MRKGIVILLFFGLLSCQYGDLINRDNVTKIVFTDKEKQIVINDKDSISTIVKKINGAMYDPAIIPKEYEVDVYYGDSIIAIFCNSNRINIDGRSYKLKKSLKTYFE